MTDYQQRARATPAKPGAAATSDAATVRPGGQLPARWMHLIFGELSPAYFCSPEIRWPAILPTCGKRAV